MAGETPPPLGTSGVSKKDEFSEKFQRGEGGSLQFWHYRIEGRTPCARNFPMAELSIVYWISQNLTQSRLMYQYQYQDMK